jgi:hypothetical protein
MLGLDHGTFLPERGPAVPKGHAIMKPDQHRESARGTGSQRGYPFPSNSLIQRRSPLASPA